VNLETANISKAVRTASRQIDAIRFLTEQGIEVDLPESLRKMAALRLKHPEATLEELGSLCSPPIGKSGVNHRLRRIVELAQQNGFK
jgi:DNA-binding protein WhiA